MPMMNKKLQKLTVKSKLSVLSVLAVPVHLPNPGAFLRKSKVNINLCLLSVCLSAHIVYVLL